MFKLGAKRRRSKAEINEQKEEERLRQEGLDRKAQQIQELTQRLQAAEAERRNNQEAADLLNRWAGEGIINQDEAGNVNFVGAQA